MATLVFRKIPRLNVVGQRMYAIPNTMRTKPPATSAIGQD